MGNPFDYFQKIYCCTIPQNTERIEFMENQAKVLDIKIEYVLGPYRPGDPLAVTENHLTAYRDALEKQYERVLVLEDDCEFLPEISNLEEVLNEWEFMQPLSVDGTRFAVDILYLGGWVMGENHPVSKHINRVSKATCLHSYVPMVGLMKRLTNQPYLDYYASRPLDLVICEDILKRGGGYIARPLMTRQWPSYSNVRGRVDNKDRMQSWSREALNDK